MTNSCSKGKRGEREWRDVLRAFGWHGARRGRQFSGSPESPDVVGGIPGTHVEVKRVEKLNLYDAIAQAVRDAGPSIPYVAHRASRRPWLVTVRASDLLDFARAVAGIQPPTPPAQPSAAIAYSAQDAIRDGVTWPRLVGDLEPFEYREAA